ncbi:MAG TPA: Flp family type IVb pilin [Rhizomicrobium sp.]
MGAPARPHAISDAARRSAAYPDAARSALSRFLRDTGGATSIEYAMIASIISIAIVAGVTALGTTLKAFFTSMVNY